MFNFFVEETNRQGNTFYIYGSDFNHIKNVLRMREGEQILVSCKGVSNLCVIAGFDMDCIKAEITEENFQDTSLPVEIYLFQGLPKSDKMELIIQKTVELGVDCIVPVEMSRCVVKLEEKKKQSKVSRWQSIAESAAKQSKRTVIPVINDVLSYKNALKKMQEMDIVLLPYENKEGMVSTKNALSKIKSGMKVGIVIGPEGGFEESEVSAAEEIGALTVSLGKRILRTETAAITAVGMCMLHCEMNEDSI